MFPRFRTVKLVLTTISLVIFSLLLLLTFPSTPAKMPLLEESIRARTLEPESLRNFYQRGNYLVLADFIIGSAPVVEAFSVTYATQSTIDYLDNIQALVEFWKGFISVTVYAPGAEFNPVLSKIAMLRQCHGKLGQVISKRVSFHIFFDKDHPPENMSGSLYEFILPEINQTLCSSEFLMELQEGRKSSPKNKTRGQSYRKIHQLLYPINMARNIARERSRTKFVLVCDIELYPNPENLIPTFVTLMKEIYRKNPDFEFQRHVFVLPPFELKKSVKFAEIPRNKTALVKLLRDKRADRFHRIPCGPCHKIRNETRWINAADDTSLTHNQSLGIFGSTRYFGVKAWEPVYIGTHSDPPFDERVYREFSLNKNVQANAMCQLDYQFHTLDNAFIVHKPGIRHGKSFWNYSGKTKVYNFSKSYIIPLQQALYGHNRRCHF